MLNMQNRKWKIFDHIQENCLNLWIRIELEAKDDAFSTGANLQEYLLTNVAGAETSALL